MVDVGPRYALIILVEACLARDSPRTLSPGSIWVISLMVVILKNVQQPLIHHPGRRGSEQLSLMASSVCKATTMKTK